MSIFHLLNDQLIISSQYLAIYELQLIGDRKPEPFGKKTKKFIY